MRGIGLVVGRAALTGLAVLALLAPTAATTSASAAESKGPIGTTPLPVPPEGGESYAWLIPAKSSDRLPLRITKRSSRMDILALQRRLNWAGFEWLWNTGKLDGGTKLALEMFQAKFGRPITGNPDPMTLRVLDRIAGTGRIDKRCIADEVVLCVDKTQKLTRYVRSGRVIKTMNTNFGPEKGHPKYGLYSATREGVFRIFDRQEHAISTDYGYPMPFWMGFDGGIGFHYSAYFDQTGYFDTSFGCTTIDNWDNAKWLYENSQIGTKVVVYSS